MNYLVTGSICCRYLNPKVDNGKVHPAVVVVEEVSSQNKTKFYYLYDKNFSKCLEKRDVKILRRGRLRVGDFLKAKKEGACSLT